MNEDKKRKWLRVFGPFFWKIEVQLLARIVRSGVVDVRENLDSFGGLASTRLPVSIADERILLPGNESIAIPVDTFEIPAQGSGQFLTNQLAVTISIPTIKSLGRFRTILGG